MGVANLGYVILEMQDPDAWAKFAKSVLGFGVTKSLGERGAKYLRMDSAPFRYMIRKGETDRFVAGGYQMSSKKAFDEQIARFERAKVTVKLGTELDAKHRAVRALASVIDPVSSWALV